MNLKLWKNFTKKSKSTLRPTAAADYDLTVYLKEDTTLDKPTFLLDSVDLSCNYAQFSGRYYFIQDIRMGITHQYELECITDYAATYKNIIGQANLFVERSSHTYDVDINDNFLSQKQTFQKDFAKFDPWYNSDVSEKWVARNAGCYVLRVVGELNDTSSTSDNPGITTLLISGKELAYALDFLFNDGNFTDVITDAIVKAFFNPFQYILSLRWVPVDLLKFQSNFSSLDSFHKLSLGWWTPTKTVQGLTDYIYGTLLKGFHVIRKKMPVMARRYNDFRDFNPNWTRIKLYVPFIGNIEIDANDYYSNNLYTTYKIDLIAGKGLFFIEYTSSNDSRVIYQSSFEFGCDMQIGQMATNLPQIAGDVAGGIAYSYSGNALAAAHSYMSAVTNFYQPTPSIKGQQASRVTCDTLEIGVIRYTADGAEFPMYYSGRPLYQHKQISSIPGYIKCADADIDLSGLAGDREEVNSLLNGGFYYE
jgi:hypothetical protein